MATKIDRTTTALELMLLGPVGALNGEPFVGEAPREFEGEAEGGAGETTESAGEGTLKDEGVVSVGASTEGILAGFWLEGEIEGAGCDGPEGEKEEDGSWAEGLSVRQ